MQKTRQKEFRIETLKKRKYDNLYIKWYSYDSSFKSWIDKKDIVQMIEYFPEPKSLGEIVKVELSSSNYAKKADLKMQQIN